jgi:hypothetical protein
VARGARNAKVGELAEILDDNGNIREIHPCLDLHLDVSTLSAVERFGTNVLRVQYLQEMMGDVQRAQ